MDNTKSSKTKGDRHRSSLTSASKIKKRSSVTHDRDHGAQGMDQRSVRNVYGYLEKFEKTELCELLASIDSHWMLSIDTYKAPTEHPNGIIRNLSAFNDSYLDILFPYDETIPRLDCREVHQILRELVIGIYVLNEHPSLSLEANVDQSTSCQLPSAYVDTRLGQIMINSDYWMKTLWHGVFITREKRIKLGERWKQKIAGLTHTGEPIPTKPVLYEFENFGIQDLVNEPDYGNAIDKYKQEPRSEEQARSDDEFFASYADDLSMMLTLYMEDVSQYNNCVMFKGNFIIQSTIKAVQERLDSKNFQRLKSLLQVHEKYIRTNYLSKIEVARYVYLLQLSCFLLSILVGMKRRMKKIPDMNKLLPMIVGDDVRTERELPPLIYGPKYQCKTFPIPDENLFHLHGGVQFEYETSTVNDTLKRLVGDRSLADLLDKSRQQLYSYLETSNSATAEFHLPIVEIDGKKFYHFVIDIEPYYGSSPIWIRMISQPLLQAGTKKLLTESLIYEIFKKYFGRKKATNCMNPEHGLRVAAQRGLASIFYSFARRTAQSGLAKANIRDGLTLMHYAAVYNRPIIIGILINMGVDVNCKQEVNYTATGGTPLHLACRHGSLDAACCLLSNMAVIQSDHQGWTPIHHAAFCDHVPILRLLYNKSSELIEIHTKDNKKSTPLLLAATSGALDSVECLYNLGANIAYKDDEGNTVIHLATMFLHTNIIDYFIQLSNPKVPTWQILVELISHPKMEMKQATVQCLHRMTNNDHEYWKPLLETGGIKRLLKLLTLKDQSLLISTLSVLCNISTNNDVRQTLASADDLPTIFGSLLHWHNDEIRSKTTILIADVCFIQSNQERFLKSDTINGIVRMLDSTLEDVLVNAVNAIDLLCRNNPDMQTELAHHGVVQQLTEVLTLNSKVLRGTVASALGALTYNHPQNQNLACDVGAVKLIVDLMQDREFGIRYKASVAIEALAINNQRNQKQLLSKELNAQKPLNELMEIRSSEEWAMEIREQAAFALWAIAGSAKSQQRYIADCIGISQIITMLLSKSEKLQYVSCNAIISLTDEHEQNQYRILKDNLLDSMMRLLKYPAVNLLSHRVVLSLVRALGVMCLGIALSTNHAVQNSIAERDGINLLITIMHQTPYIDVKVECCLTLARVVLNNSENQEQLSSIFNVEEIMTFLDITDSDLKMHALLTISLFAYNNLENQARLKEANTISYDAFKPFIESNNLSHCALACFQIVVLARIIGGNHDQVSLTALGIMKLADLLLENNPNLITQTAKYIASLARTRTGISDGMIVCNILDRLIDKLNSNYDDETRCACAVAIGYLTYNKTAFRLLYNLCRRDPSLFDKIIQIGHRSSVSPEFIQYFETERAQGLPVDSLSIQLRVLEPRAPSAFRRSALKSSTSTITDVEQDVHRFPRIKTAPIERLDRRFVRPHTTATPTLTGKTMPLKKRTSALGYPSVASAGHTRKIGSMTISSAKAH